MLGKIKQVSFVSDEPFSNPDLYLEHLRAKLAATFFDTFDDKYRVNFWVAVYLRYTHPTKDLNDLDTIILHSGKRIVTSPVVLDKQHDSLIDTFRERHITFNRNLSGLLLDEIIKSDLRVAEYIPRTGLKFQELPPFPEKKHAVINLKNTET